MASPAHIPAILFGALCFVSLARATSPTQPTPPSCYNSGERCLGAPGHDFIAPAGCCAPNEFCLPSIGGDWGSRCQTITTLFSNGNCYSTGDRCGGIQGSAFVAWQPCCNATDMCMPVTTPNDWGFRCSSTLLSSVPPFPSIPATMNPLLTTETTTGAPSTHSSSQSPSASPSPAAADKCKGFQANRKEIMDMSDSEWSAYAAGIDALRRSGVYAQFVDYHSTYALQAHGGCYFLPWHRQLLFEFERELQTVAPGVAIPYWDWTKSAPDGGSPISQRFADDPIWNRVGGAVANSPIPSAPFTDWTVSGSQVIRGFSVGDGNIGGGGSQFTFLSSQQVNTLSQTPSSTFEAMANFLEANHGTPHVAVGGNMAVVTTSPSDPIFWSHHAYVDKIWHDWQISGNGNMFDGTMSNPQRTCTLDGEQMNPPAFGRTVRQILEDISPCVGYAISSRAGPSSRILDHTASVHQTSVPNAFSATSSSSSTSTAFAFASSSQIQSYQLAAAQNKASNPASYKSQVQVAYDGYQSMVLGAQKFGVPPNVVESAKTSYNVLSLKDGVNLIQDLPILNMDVSQITSSAQAQVQSLMNGQGFLTMNNFLNPAF